MYLSCAISWLIFRNCSCASAHVEEGVRCLGVLTSLKQVDMFYWSLNALAAGHQARCICWKKMCQKKGFNGFLLR